MRAHGEDTIQYEKQFSSLDSCFLSVDYGTTQQFEVSVISARTMHHVVNLYKNIADFDAHAEITPFGLKRPPHVNLPSTCHAFQPIQCPQRWTCHQHQIARPSSQGIPGARVSKEQFDRPCVERTPFVSGSHHAETAMMKFNDAKIRYALYGVETSMIGVALDTARLLIQCVKDVSATL